MGKDEYLGLTKTEDASPTGEEGEKQGDLEE